MESEDVDHTTPVPSYGRELACLRVRWGLTTVPARRMLGQPQLTNTIQELLANGLDALGMIFLLLHIRFAGIVLLLLVAYVNMPVASALPIDHASSLTFSNFVAAGFGMQYSSYYCYPWDPYWCYPYYWGYHWWYYPHYYYAYYYPTEVQTAKAYELKVETSPAGIAPVNGRGTYSGGSVAPFSLTSLIVSLGTSQRYVFSYWSGDFSGTAPSGSITMDAAKTVVANYELQNYLTVSAEPLGITSVAGDGWYRPGEYVSIGAVPQMISGGQGVRYVFQQWTIDSAPVSGNTVEVTMDVPHRVVAHYKTQYLLTVLSEYGTVVGSGWYDSGSLARFSVNTTVDARYGVREVFERWTGDAEFTSPTAAVTMDSPHTVSAVWRTDSTILYATIALGLGGAFVLVIGLTAIAIGRTPRTEAAKETPLKPAASVGTSAKKSKTGRKKVKPLPKTESEVSRETSS